MTEKELNQLYYLRREISMWENRLRELSDIAPRGYGSRSRTGSTGSPVIRLAEQREKIRTIIYRKKVEVYRQEEEITRYITKIEDSQMRQIMYMRHVKLMSWTAIALALGGNNTGDGVRKAHKRFLQKNQKK